LIRRELSIFLVVGLLTVLVDFVFYLCLVRLKAFDTDAAKGLSFLTGTAFAYLANRNLTFSAFIPLPGSAVRFAALYGLSLSVNVVINAAVLILIPAEIEWKSQVAFLCAAGVSATLNFLGMKFFVFKPDVIQELS
jgi:putative flippase GtrA